MVFDKHDLIIRKHLVKKDQMSIDIFEAEALGDMINKISSCAVKAIYDDAGSFKHFQVKFYSFANKDYNEVDYTIEVYIICNKIKQFNIDDYSSSRYIYFNQSSLESIDKAFEPLMLHLAVSMHDQWKQFEIEDLFQICRLCLCKLYNKGYCIHPSILKRAFVNEVLLQMRKNKNNTDIRVVSLETPIFTSKERDLTIADAIEDVDYNNRIEDIEYEHTIQSIYEKISKIIIKDIGERRYHQLMTAHKNKCANGSQRMLIIRLRKMLADKGYDKEWLHKVLRGDI